MHGAAACLCIFRWGENAPVPHRRHGSRLAHASTPWRAVDHRPSMEPTSPLRSTIGRRRRPLRLCQPQSRLTSPGRCQPGQPSSQPARWRSRMLDRGKTYPSPAAPPKPHEYLCVTSPQYLPFLSRPCVKTRTSLYQPGRPPWPVPGISLETLWGSTLSIALAASSPCLSGTKCFMMAVASQH